MSTIAINNTLRLQHPYLYCQAAGSDGSDGTKSGVHVRWDLLKDLGYNHIPKGNLATGNVGFNKPADFVTLYRTPYTTDRIIVIDFTTLDQKLVTYLPNSTGLTYNVSTATTTNTIIVRFLDRPKFKSIMDAGLDPRNPIQDFLNKYTGIIEIEVQGKLMFFY